VWSDDRRDLGKHGSVIRSSVGLCAPIPSGTRVLRDQVGAFAELLGVRAADLPVVLGRDDVPDLAERSLRRHVYVSVHSLQNSPCFVTVFD
jgi:hypothetical protein